MLTKSTFFLELMGKNRSRIDLKAKYLMGL